MKKFQSVNANNHKNQHKLTDNRIFIDIYSVKELGENLKCYKAVTLTNHDAGSNKLSITLHPGCDIIYSCRSVKNIIKKICYTNGEEYKINMVKSEGAFKPSIAPKPATLNKKQVQIKQSKFEFYGYKVEFNREFILPFDVDKSKIDDVYQLMTTISHDGQINLSLLRTYYKNIKAYNIVFASQKYEQNHNISKALINIRNLKFLQIMDVCNEFRADDKKSFCFFEELPNDIIMIIGGFYHEDIIN